MSLLCPQLCLHPLTMFFFLSSELTSAQTRKTWKFLNLDLVDVTEVYFRFTVVGLTNR